MNHCVAGEVRGRVQGVFFRRYVQDIAEAIGVQGYARNLPDGGVEILLCGAQADVHQVQEAVARGSPSSRVASVTWRVVEDCGCEGFTIG